MKKENRIEYEVLIDMINTVKESADHIASLEARVNDLEFELATLQKDMGVSFGLV